jgi:hypothetical protein
MALDRGSRLDRRPLRWIVAPASIPARAADYALRANPPYDFFRFFFGVSIKGAVSCW